MPALRTCDYNLISRATSCLCMWATGYRWHCEVRETSRDEGLEKSTLLLTSSSSLSPPAASSLVVVLVVVVVIAAAAVAAATRQI